MKIVYCIGALCILSFSACKKVTPSTTLNEVEQVKASTDYLVLNNYDELNALIASVPSMSDADYESWKEKNGNFKSLYDRYRNLGYKTESAINSNSRINLTSEENLHFMLASDGRLRITSAGELLSHFLNWNGLLQVGNVLMRYEGGNIYYTTSAYVSLANGNTVNLDANNAIKMAHIGDLIREAKRQIDVTGKAVIIPAPANPGFGQMYTSTTYLFSDRYTTDKRRFFMELLEEFNLNLMSTATPTAEVRWIVGYVLYMKFGHQKKSTFGWNSSKSSTYVQTLSYNGDFPSGHPSTIFNFFRPTVTASLPAFTLPYGENQYYTVAAAPKSSDYTFPGNQQSFTINAANFINYFISATGDGQPWYDKTYITP